MQDRRMVRDTSLGLQKLNSVWRRIGQTVEKLPDLTSYRENPGFKLIL